MADMTETPTIHNDTRAYDLTRIITFEDKGIEVVKLDTSWGCTLKFRRTGRTLPWRVTINHEGRACIYKPLTSTLPPVSLEFPPDQWENCKMMLVNFIQGGWI